ncbi:MAG: AAA family ATPase [Spirochaetes bacterium]|jgi:chromosome partitioning protein|nr:AAA family ATPase [Spirochaetota bacterium]
MGNTIVFANQKGGVGKTTSAVNLGAFLAEQGRRVLLIDFDPQGNLSSSVGKSTQGHGIYEVITEEIDAKSAVETTSQAKLSIIPSSINLTGANIELVEVERREYFLRNAIAGIQDEYDYIFIDSPPSLGLLTLNGLVAADAVIIPLQCEYFAMEGLTQLLQSIKRVQQSYNADLSVSGILFTMYDSRTRLAQDVVQEVVGYFGKRVFRTIIPRNVRLSEAPSHGIPINQYDPESTGGKSYRKLAEEVIERG